MRIDTKILMLTFNRPDYTDLSLSRLCDSIGPNTRVVVWDNGSGDETIAVLEKFKNHPRIETIIFNDFNAGQITPTNWFWENSQNALFLSKVDDDCLMPDGWCEVLQKAHFDIPDAGILGCWRFQSDDFRPTLATKKIQTFGRHRIMRNCWVEGSGYIMKRSILDKLGYMFEKESFTGFCIRAAASGYINGWYYPFLHQEHMDDPRAEHTGMKSEADFQRLKPVSAANFGINSLGQWTARLRGSAERLQTYSHDPKDWSGITAKVKRKIQTLLGNEYLPKV